MRLITVVQFSCDTDFDIAHAELSHVMDNKVVFVSTDILV